MLTIKRYFSDNNHYVDLLGFNGNAFVKSIEWLWHIKSEDYEERQYSLSEFTTPDVMSCVYAFVGASLTENAQNTINDYIALLYNEDGIDSMLDDNTIEYNQKDNIDYISYKCMNYHFVRDVIWCAYMFCNLKSPIDEKYVQAEKILYNTLSHNSGYKESCFEKSFFLMKQKSKTAKIYLSEVGKAERQQKEKEADEEKKQNEITQKLCEYRDHPVYGLGYDSIVSYLGTAAMNDGIEFSESDYLAIFVETETCVNRVLKSRMPEIEISRVKSSLGKKYKNYEQKYIGGTLTVITPQYRIGCMIEMLFLIAVYDMLPKRSERVMNALKDCRAFVENQSYSDVYKHNEMWKLVAERIPPRPNRPRTEDLEVEVSKLKNELAKFQNGDASTEWHEMTMDVIAVFDQTMNPVGFYEIPKIKELSKLGQCKFVIRLLTSQIPYAVALLHTISFMDYLAKQQGYESQESRLRIIEKALKLSPNNRSLKGNFNVLKPDSNEDKSKYTACTLLDEAESFYNSLPLIPN